MLFKFNCNASSMLISIEAFENKKKLNTCVVLKLTTFK